MIYDNFVEKLSAYSKYIIFEKSENKENPYNPFYNLYNPKQVEFEFNSSDIIMLPYQKIAKISEEYLYLDCDFVFALANSDPYFVKGGKVYTCYHGDRNPDLEFVANSFEEFLDIVIKEI